MGISNVWRAAIAGTAIVAIAATPVPNDVVTIKIESTWGGLGRPQAYHGEIRRQGNGFVRDDGSPVDTKLVDAFLNALNGPHPVSVTASDVGLTPALLKAQVNQAESCLGQSRSVDGVRAAFEGQYFDQATIAHWLDDDFHLRHTDDYPSLSVDVTTKSGTIAVNSDSQHLFMLPFTMGKDGRQVQSFDPAIPHALAALMPANAANRARLENASLLSNWAFAICTSDAVRNEQNKLGKSDVQSLAARYGLALNYFGHNTGMDRWVVTVADVKDPRITAEVQSSNAEGAADFGQTQRRMALVRSIPWLKRQLDATSDAWIHIQPGRGGIFTFDPPRFRRMNRPHAAALLEAHQSDSTLVWMGESNGNKAWSSWYLFPDGTMILQEFQPGVPPFPFAPDGYERLPLVGTAASPPAIGGQFADPHVAALIIYPDGTIETRNP